MGFSCFKLDPVRTGKKISILFFLLAYFAITNTVMVLVFQLAVRGFFPLKYEEESLNRHKT